ncbi:AarF/ABC1/UbiB kinase family protein [Acinetobacter sp. B5B]|uniref:ABC1 kinase family protein n=1 Tax=Acinetobacter baretiae TaxID=2605383 RepID=UPI0018C2EFB1|nr:AarF/ABC1/UbiB kinase family protein [Acinetobacter baretiae]MBF7682410.1 AarF/ABC1/UbiB kinase family protein [Acinetobacter baretiae]
MADQKDILKNLKTSSLDRRFSIAKASFLAGTRWATSSASSFFASDEEKERKRKKILTEQANYLVSEIGKLKGSIVKIGQMMALYGEHFLPREVTDALNTLNNQTIAVDWAAIEPHLLQQLGVKADDLEIDQHPIGTASLAQVHKAVLKSTGQQLVLKIQYPGVADAIDSDMNLFKQMLRLTHLLPQTREFDQWFEEVREMMHREVDYALEAQTTLRFANYLKDDERYVVPQIIEQYCTDQVLCMSYESGLPVNSPTVLSLSQTRRNKIGEASLEIAIKELFVWGEMQTDPNFGNYLVRVSATEHEIDKIVLLDFGAIRQFDQELLTLAHNLIHAGYLHRLEDMVQAMKGYPFFDQIPADIKPDMAKVFLLATEPFSSSSNNSDIPEGVITQEDQYDWKKSQLHQRVMQRASKSMASRYFSVPPKEFMFISRKFIGAYTFMTVISAQTNIRNSLKF